MAVRLSSYQIERLIRSPKVAAGLEDYRWIQSRIRRGGWSREPEFDSVLAKFYGLNMCSALVRQSVLQELRHMRPWSSYIRVLHNLLSRSGRIEASFASKLVATFHPERPVIDKWVLRNTGISLPKRDSANRIRDTLQAYENLDRWCRQFLRKDVGRYLVRRFTVRHLAWDLSHMKMLDFILWQAR